MHQSFIPPRQVGIGDAASFVGTTPRAIRHYETLGLLPELTRGGDGRRRFGQDDVIRLLWIRKMTEAGIALGDIRDAFTGGRPTDADADADADVTTVLERLERDLAAREAELGRQRAAVENLRRRGRRTGLLDDLVAQRLEGLPEDALSQADLDTLLVTERIFSPLGAAIQAGRFLALAAHPDLRAEADRVDAAEEGLDDTVATDDPRVAAVAAERHAFEEELLAVIRESGQDEDDQALIDLWDRRVADLDGAASPGDGPATARAAVSLTVAEMVGKMPYDFSPARLRCMELALELSSGADVGGVT